MNNIGITGSTGVLGRILIEKLEKGRIEYQCFKGDIRHKDNLKDWIKDNNFKSVIHFAAIVPTTEVKQNPDKARDVNVRGTKNLIEAIEDSKQNPWIFYASTCHVYKSKNKPISENDEIEPISIYGKTKYDAEKFVTRYGNSCIGRIFSFYHDSQKKPFLYPNIMDRLKNENLTKSFELYGANSVRDFLNAEEIVDIIIELMEKKAKGIYNIASGNGIKIKDFVQKLTDKKLTIKEKGDNDYIVADITKLNKVLNR